MRALLDAAADGLGLDYDDGNAGVGEAAGAREPGEAGANNNHAALHRVHLAVFELTFLMSEDIVGLLRDASVGLLRVGLLRAALRKF